MAELEFAFKKSELEKAFKEQERTGRVVLSIPLSEDDETQESAVNEMISQLKPEPAPQEQVTDTAIKQDDIPPEEKPPRAIATEVAT